MAQTRHDAVLGTLALQEGLNWYEGQQATDSETFKVYVSLDAFPGEDEAFATARTVFPTLVRAIRNAKEFARDRLLGLKNTTWLDSGETPISSEAFFKTLRLQSLAIYVDGDSEFNFTCGNLFAGHIVLVSWNKTEGFSDAIIAG
jgi:hypothetical protein